jgi:hypothetical protein
MSVIDVFVLLAQNGWMNDIYRTRGVCKDIYTDPTFEFHYTQFLKDLYAKYEYDMSVYEERISHVLWEPRCEPYECDTCERAREYVDTGRYESWLMDTIDAWESYLPIHNTLTSHLGISPISEHRVDGMNRSKEILGE